MPVEIRELTIKVNVNQDQSSQAAPAGSGTGDNPNDMKQALVKEAVEQMVRKGERRRLRLSNYAIDAYRKFATERRCLVMVS